MERSGSRGEEGIMQRRQKVLIGALVATFVLAASALVAGASGRQSTLGQGDPQASQVTAAETCPPTDPKPNQTTEIATAKLIIEYNSTDQDIGVHGAFDDHGWKTLCVFDPNGRLVLEVSPQSQLRDLTMAGIFFESREPPSSEFSFADLEATFPEGEYTVRAESFDGQILVGSATFTHDVPAPPTIESPVLADDPRGTKKNPVPLEDRVISWADVTETVAGEPVDITGYEVIVTKEVDDDPNGFSRPTYDVHVPPNANSLRVPVEFLEADTVYELEVLALEVSGNQTITVGFFKTVQGRFGSRLVSIRVRGRRLGWPTSEGVGHPWGELHPSSFRTPRAPITVTRSSGSMSIGDCAGHHRAALRRGRREARMPAWSGRRRASRGTATWRSPFRSSVTRDPISSTPRAGSRTSS